MDREEKALDESGRADELPPAARDELHRVLSRQLCRRVLTHLLEKNESSVDELADVLSGWETENGVVSAERHRQIRIALHHQHLPQLATAGLVTFDPGTGHVVMEELDSPRRALLQQSLEGDPS